MNSRIVCLLFALLLMANSQIACPAALVEEPVSELATESAAEMGSSSEAASESANREPEPDASANELVAEPIAEAAGEAVVDAGEIALPDPVAADDAPDVTTAEQVGSNDVAQDPRELLAMASEVYRQKYILAVCTLIHGRCCVNGLSNEAKRGYGNNKAECLQKVPASPDGLSLIKSSILNGRLGFDQAKANKTLAELQAFVCRDFAKVFPKGTAPYTPMVGKGGACSNALECKAGLFCKGLSAGTGSCQDRLPLGAACLNTESGCQSGLLCWIKSLNQPKVFLCKKSRAEGQSCDNVNAPCEAGTFCQSQKCTSDLRAFLCK